MCAFTSAVRTSQTHLNISVLQDSRYTSRQIFIRVLAYGSTADVHIHMKSFSCLLPVYCTLAGVESKASLIGIDTTIWATRATPTE